jgi:hypothetical protein
METVKVDKRTTKTPEQLEILRLAREKAASIRAEKSQVKQKLKNLKEEAFQRDKELVEKMEKAKAEPPPPQEESEEEVEVVKKPKKKKIVYVSDSEEEEEIVKKPPTKKVVEPPVLKSMNKYEIDQRKKEEQSQRMRSMLFGRY